jgi:hypothetical protein
MVLVVILIFLTLISAVVAAALWAEYKQSERRLDSLKKMVPDLQNEEAAIKAAMTKCNEATGFPATEAGTLDATKPADALRKWRQEYWSPDHLNKFPFTPSEGGAKRMPDGDVTRFNEARDTTRYRDTLEQLVDLAVQRTSHAKNRTEQLQVDLKIAQDQAAGLAKVAPEIPKEKEKTKAQLLAQIQKLQEEIAKENDQYNTRKSKLTEDRRPSSTSGRGSGWCRA